MTGSRREGIVLQDRDLRLLRELDVLRIIDREMAKVVAGFHSTRRANARLLQLTRGGLLKRFFVGSIANGRKAIYTLSAKGADLVEAKLGGIHRQSGRLIVGDAFVAHQSGINDIYIALKYLPTPEVPPRLIRWHTFRQSISDSVKLTPDGYLELSTSYGVKAMFLEVDQGTEALSIWQQKTAYYLQLAVSGEFPQRFRQTQFRVLVVANSDRRLAHIRTTVARSTDKIFWFSTLDIIHREGIWSSIWLRPAGDQRHSLV